MPRERARGVLSIASNGRKKKAVRRLAPPRPLRQPGSLFKMTTAWHGRLAAAAAGAALALAALSARRAARRWLARRCWRAVGLKARLLEARRRDFCPAQSVSYVNTDPLLVVEGRGARLIDERGRSFLDTRNNVAHVGHAHPAVAAAVAAQVSTLNTNTRYLHPTVCELARRLLDTMPAPLRDGVVFFVNSGSEANDLALRLARAANTRGARAGGLAGGTPTWSPRRTFSEPPSSRREPLPGRRARLPRPHVGGDRSVAVQV